MFSISPMSNSIIFDFVYLIVLINLSSDLPVTSTLAPLFIKDLAVSLPIPRLPPVRIMFLPYKFIL